MVGAADYLSLLIDKLLWASILWLLSAGLGGLPVGDVARRHGAAQQELAGELLPLAQAYLAAAARRLQLPGGAEQVGGHLRARDCTDQPWLARALRTALPVLVACLQRSSRAK